MRGKGLVSMEYADILHRLAPCGLFCGNCVAFAGGAIQEHAQALAGKLGDNFGVYAERFAAMNPVFEGYSAFRELLDYMAQGSCSGCRGKGCLFKSCKVTECVRDKGVDFCFECKEFPCETHSMPPGLAERWQKNNEKMRDMGVGDYFDAFTNKPRYP